MTLQHQSALISRADWSLLLVCSSQCQDWLLRKSYQGIQPSKHIYVSLTFFPRSFFSLLDNICSEAPWICWCWQAHSPWILKDVIYFPVNSCFILFVFRITGAAGAHLSGHWAKGSALGTVHTLIPREFRDPKLRFKPDPFSWKATVLHHHRGKVDCTGGVCRPSVYPSSGVSISIAGIK